MGSGVKCNQTGCDEDLEAMECAKELQQREMLLSRLGDTSIHEVSAIISRYLTKARGECEAYKVEYESRAIWIAEMNKLLGYDNSDGFHSTPCPFEIAKALKARTSEAHIHECAVKALERLVDGRWIEDNVMGARSNIVAIICEAFGAPAKDECEEAAEAAWQSYVKKLDLICNATEAKNLCHVFKTAWKLAKGESPKGFAGTGPDMNQVIAEKAAREWHGNHKP